MDDQRICTSQPSSPSVETQQAFFELLKAYHSTRYVLTAEPYITLRIGQLPCWPHGHMLATSHWCWITAANPGSQLCEPAVNIAAQSALLQTITQQQLPYWPCVARDDAGLWPEEAGFVVGFGDVLAARQWAHQACCHWCQLGILLGGPGQAVQLLLWRDHSIFSRWRNPASNDIQDQLWRRLSAMNIALL